MRPSASLARALSWPGSAPARRTTGKTIPSGSESRATSRCSGSIRWWSEASALRWALASASCALWVNALTSMDTSTSSWYSTASRVLLFSGSVVAAWRLVANDRGGVADQVTAGRAAGRLQLLAVSAGLRRQRLLQGGDARLQPVDLLLQCDHPGDPGEVDAQGGQLLDRAQALDVTLGVAARVGRGPLGPYQTLALVDAQGLGMNAGQLGRHGDDEYCPVVGPGLPGSGRSGAGSGVPLVLILIRHGDRLTVPCSGATVVRCPRGRRTRAAAPVRGEKASRARSPAQ